MPKNGGPTFGYYIHMDKLQAIIKLRSLFFYRVGRTYQTCLASLYRYVIKKRKKWSK